MKAGDALQKIIKTVAEIKAKNQKWISVDAFSIYLTTLGDSVANPENEKKSNVENLLSYAQLEQERSLAQYDAQQKSSLELPEIC